MVVDACLTIRSHFNCYNQRYLIKYFLSPRFYKKKRSGYCNRVSPSVVRLSLMLSPPKPLDETKKVGVTHMNGASNVELFWPRPLGPWRGLKGQTSFNFNYKVNFKDLFYQTFCVFSQMKENEKKNLIARSMNVRLYSSHGIKRA